MAQLDEITNLEKQVNVEDLGFGEEEADNAEEKKLVI